MADLLSQYLLVGDFLGFIQAVFTSTMGAVFYGFITLLVTVPLYLRYQSLMILAIVVTIMSAGFYYIIPAAGMQILSVVLVLGLGGLITYLFTRLS